MTVYVWCPPRLDGGGVEPLKAGDLLAAVDAWERGQLQDRKGQPPRGCPLAAVALHPWLLDPELAPPQFRRGMEARHEALAADIAALERRGIEVVPGPGGCLSWEVWLYPLGDGTPPPEYVLPCLRIPREAEVGTEPPPAPVLPPSHAFPPRLKGATNHRGRNPVPFPLERLRALAAKGLGAKAAHAQLLSEGHQVTLRTVARRLREVDGGAPQ